jgi:hypothetical protein
MTKSDIKKTSDEMAKLLIKLCRYSDGAWLGNRSKRAETDYKKARRLIRQAGFEYEPKSPAKP